MSEKQYVCYHLHSFLSNGTTTLDSVTKFQDYIDVAKKYGMKAMGFAEHGSVFEWWHKKCAIEAAGMKYLHGVEAYLTETLDEKLRDNYHCVLIAKNLEGLYEINKLVSRSFNIDDKHCLKLSKDIDNHYYYSPRITFNELFNTSENVIVTTACIGGVLYKGSEKCKQQMIDFLVKNRTRCFLEIGHHLDEKQKQHNVYLFELSKKYNIPLIAGTDTHALNELHEKGRAILQKAKNIHFEDEDKWDLKFHSYEELVSLYKLQNALPENVYLQAIENTNLMADMVENIEIDRGMKYPHIYDNPIQTFRDKVDKSIKSHKYINERYSKEEIEEFKKEELAVYEKADSINFMLLQTYLREWERSQGIQCGYGRGSVSGSEIAYALGITEMDSKKFNLNFFRFMNPDRVSLADIDTDYGDDDRDRVKEFLLKEHMGLEQIRTSEIITFNTIAGKGAIRDVGRALEIPLETISEICKYYDVCQKANEKNLEKKKAELKTLEDVKEKYSDLKELFEYVDIVYGTITSIGTHPSGVLVCDSNINIAETIGLCSTSTSDYPISMLNMKELDDLMYVKLDILGLSNIKVINEACKMANIERLTPDNVNLEDEDVWKSIRDDTTAIFQWESNSAQIFLRKFMSDETLRIAKNKIPNFSTIKWLSFGNGLLRPACASFRNSVAEGEFYDNGFKELNDFLAPEAGRIAMQETIMQFLVKFCGYSNAESDTVRRAIAKKKGTEVLLPEIEKRFIDYSSAHYDITREKCEEIIKPFIQVILDASEYAFSWNHSDSYSITGYICGYLRYYYPLEFLTASLNTFDDNKKKTASIIKYAKKRNIRIVSPKFGVSRGKYFYNKENNTIAKGISSVKYLNETVADELYELSQKKKYISFIDLLFDMSNISINSKQIEVLIKIDYFSQFGNQRELWKMYDMFNFFKSGEAKQIKKESVAGSEIESFIKKYSNDKTKNGKESKSYTLLDTKAILKDIEKYVLSIEMEDLSDIIKSQNFEEYMGYSGYVSGKESDRRKLFIKEIYPVKRKKDGVQFGYSISTQSIGSGIESRFTVFNRVFNKEPIKKGEIIKCLNYTRDGKYFVLNAYEHIY